jgi:seryl-tRNA synthetase
MTTLNESIAGAIGNAMHGAVLGQTIGRAKQDAQDGWASANAWRDHAKMLEKKVDNLEAQLRVVNQQLANKQNELNEYQAMAGRVIEKGNLQLIHNIEYGQAIKARLRQMEKALQHSSCDKESMRFMIGAYQKLVTQIDESGNFRAEVKTKADQIWETYMSGGKLTEDKDIQEMIDKTPMPTKLNDVMI